MLLKLFETPLSNKCPQREPGISKIIQFNQVLNLFLMSTDCLVLQALRSYQVANTLILFSLSIRVQIKSSLQLAIQAS